MKQNYKSKFMSLILGTGLILGSCSTSNNVVSGGIFTKRKYTNGYHSNVKKNFKSDEVKNDEEALFETENPTKGVSGMTLAKKEVKADLIKIEKVISAEAVEGEENSLKQIEKVDKEAVVGKNTSLKGNNAIESNLKENKSGSKIFAMKKNVKKMSAPGHKDSGFLRLLFLIILAILLIALIQMLLPGSLVGSIISLLLLILLVLFILRIFGVF